MNERRTMKIDVEGIRVGVPLIDRQHEEFLDIMDRLLDQYETEPPLADAQLIEETERLLRYAVEHFDAEEKLMQSIDYPLYAKHLDKHDEFRREADRWNRAFDGHFDRDTYSLKLTEWVLEWFYEQVRHDDLELAVFIQKRGGPGTKGK